jgi:hypothetical protein
VNGSARDAEKNHPKYGDLTAELQQIRVHRNPFSLVRREGELCIWNYSPF